MSSSWQLPPDIAQQDHGLLKGSMRLSVLSFRDVGLFVVGRPALFFLLPFINVL